MSSRRLQWIPRAKPRAAEMGASLTLLLLAASCSPPPPSGKAPDTDINAGVNLVPEAVLAAEKMTPDTTQPAPADKPDLISTLSQSLEPHEMVLRALRDANLVPLLQTAGPWTLLAPTDRAFSKLPPGLMAQLLSAGHEPELRNLMRYHLLKGNITAKEMLLTNGPVTTLNGARLIIRGIDGKVTVNDANVIATEATASNGVIHWIDNVLLPP